MFILASDGRDEDVDGEVFRRYQDYLASVKDRFPRSAFEIATSNWYFNFSDHRCPHDGWVESIVIEEHAHGKRREHRHISIRVTLLGAYHDGLIELLYPKVVFYRFDMRDGRHGHCDWRYDELRLSERGNLIHEIEWCRSNETGTWLIEASDLEFRWVPKAGLA